MAMASRKGKDRMISSCKRTLATNDGEHALDGDLREGAVVDGILIMKAGEKELKQVFADLIYRTFGGQVAGAVLVEAAEALIRGEQLGNVPIGESEGGILRFAGGHELGFLIPWCLGDQQAHAAPIGDTGKDQSRTDKATEPDKGWIHELRKQHAAKHDAACGDAHLTFQTDDLGFATIHGQSCLDPRERAAFDDDGVWKTSLSELVSGLGRTLTAAAEDIHGLFDAKSMMLVQVLRIKRVERHTLCRSDMDFGEFDGRAHVDDVL